MTLPPPNATTDDILDQLLDAEGLLRERLDLALTMLRRTARDCWSIELEDGEWWWVRLSNDPVDYPAVASTEPESRLWEALRKGAK